MKVNTEKLREKLDEYEYKHGVVAAKESDCVNCVGCYKWVGAPACRGDW